MASRMTDNPVIWVMQQPSFNPLEPIDGMASFQKIEFRKFRLRTDRHTVRAAFKCMICGHFTILADDIDRFGSQLMTHFCVWPKERRDKATDQEVLYTLVEPYEERA